MTQPKPTHGNGRFWSTGELALLLGVTLNTVKLWCKKGLIPAKKTPGGHWRIDAAEFEAFRSKSS